MFVFVTHVFGNEAQAARLVDQLTALYGPQESRVIVICDGPSEFRAEGVEVVKGVRLKNVSGTAYLQRWLTFATTAVIEHGRRPDFTTPLRWIIQVDPDAQIHRRFDEASMPDADVFGHRKQAQGKIDLVRGTCLGMTYAAARRMLDSRWIQWEKFDGEPYRYDYAPTGERIAMVDRIIATIAYFERLSVGSWRDVQDGVQAVTPPENIDGRFAVTSPWPVAVEKPTRRKKT